MFVQSFAALFLAHVIADYLLQTTWLVTNKRKPQALGLHIGTVFVTMMLTTLSFSPWFVVLALAHLCIDILKTFILRDGLMSYVADQLLHVLSITAIAAVAPGIWAGSPLSGVEMLPAIYLMAAGLIFAARGGQFAVLIFLGNTGKATVSGGYLGWGERVVLCLAAVFAGVWAALAVIVLKLLSLVPQLRTRAPANRVRLIWGAGLSLAWGTATAIPLALMMMRLS